jgi:hypothetical protein
LLPCWNSGFKNGFQVGKAKLSLPVETVRFEILKLVEPKLANFIRSSVVSACVRKDQLSHSITTRQDCYYRCCCTHDVAGRTGNAHAGHAVPGDADAGRAVRHATTVHDAEHGDASSRISSICNGGFPLSVAIIKYELCPQIPCSLSVPSLTLAPAQGVMGMTEPAQPTAGGKLRRKRRKQEKVFPPLPTIFRAGPHLVRRINKSQSSQTRPAKAAHMCGLRDSRSRAGRVLQKTPHG